MGGGLFWGLPTASNRAQTFPCALDPVWLCLTVVQIDRQQGVPTFFRLAARCPGPGPTAEEHYVRAIRQVRTSEHCLVPQMGQHLAGGFVLGQ